MSSSDTMALQGDAQAKGREKALDNAQDLSRGLAQDEIEERGQFIRFASPTFSMRSSTTAA